MGFKFTKNTHNMDLVSMHASMMKNLKDIDLDMENVKEINFKKKYESILKTLLGKYSTITLMPN